VRVSRREARFGLPVPVESFLTKTILGCSFSKPFHRSLAPASSRRFVPALFLFISGLAGAGFGKDLFCQPGFGHANLPIRHDCGVFVSIGVRSPPRTLRLREIRPVLCVLADATSAPPGPPACEVMASTRRSASVCHQSRCSYLTTLVACRVCPFPFTRF